MVHLVWIGGTGVLQSILSSLILKVYHALAFKPITIIFGKFTNFWMLFQITCPIFNSIDIECSYQEKICSYPVPCLFRTWPILCAYYSAASWDRSTRFQVFSACKSKMTAHLCGMVEFHTRNPAFYSIKRLFKGWKIFRKHLKKCMAIPSNFTCTELGYYLLLTSSKFNLEAFQKLPLKGKLTTLESMLFS